MESRIDHYVEFWDINSREKKIESRIDFLEKNMKEIQKWIDGLYNDGFRFYDREVIFYKGLEYSSEPINYSPWINKHTNGLGALDDDSIYPDDYLEELKKDCALQLSLFK